MTNPATKESAPDASQSNAVSLEQHRQRLHERDELLRAILNTASDAIITINQRGLIENMNPATEKMFGYAPEELVGQNVKLLMPPPYRDQHDGYLARYLQTREPHIIGFGREAVGCRKDGTVFPISLAVSEVDHLNLFTGFIRDLSPLKELQRHVLDIADEEQQRIGLELHDGVAQELTGMSLYVRGLLNLVAELQQNLSSPAGGIPEQQAALEEVQKIALTLSQRLNETHQHVRELSHGMMPVQLDAEGLRAALEELAASISKSGGIACVIEHPRPVTDLGNSTATHLYRIAQEAVNNAVRHSRAERVAIRLEPLDSHILLEITDDGVGINIRRESPGGTNGSGLRTMYYRANLIGAHLQIDAPPEGGTRVRCVVIKERPRP